MYGGPGLRSAMDAETICSKGNLRSTRVHFNLHKATESKGKSKAKEYKLSSYLVQLFSGLKMCLTLPAFLSYTMQK